MADPQKEKRKLTVRQAPRLDAIALEAYRAVQTERTDTSGGLATLGDLLRRCDFYEVMDGDRIIGRYALRVNQFSNGAEGDIAAAVGCLPGVDLTASLLPHIEAQFAGVQAVKIETKRRSLARKFLAAGYHIDGYILRKRVA